MALFQKKKKHGKSSKSKKGAKSKIMKGPAHRKIAGGFAALSFLLILILSAITISSCQYSNAFSKKLYVAEIRRNITSTSQMQLSVGYFGGCVTVGDPKESPETKCVMNLHAIDEDDLFEELTEELETKPDGLSNFMNETLDEALFLQQEVFHWALPVAHLILFTLGSCMLFVASTNLKGKKSYAYMLAFSALCVVFSLGLDFASGFGSLRALHSLVNQEGSKFKGWTFGSGNEVHFANALYFVHLASASLEILFALAMAGLFVGAVGPSKKAAYKQVHQTV